MRSQLLSFIGNIGSTALGTFTVSSQLPWDNSGTPLYMANMKTIYVDADQIDQSSVSDTFNGAGFVSETTTNRVYFVTDAKQLPANYEALVSAIKGARTMTATQDYVQKLCQVTTDFDSDRVITQFEFSFRKTLTN